MCNGISTHTTRNPQPELLSPAGSFDCLKAAVNCGCDAVYLGGKDFSARASAANFGVDELEAAFAYCHLRGVKVYVAVNTLLKDGELGEALRFAEACGRLGADAFIVQDAGLARAIKDAAPDLPLHASTQMTVKTVADAEFLRDAGFARVILSRELSLDEIETISKSAGVETEVFVHGALCVCYSGQCLMSAMIGEKGGRSGNRGGCAQPCRLKYGFGSAEGYLLSPRDICAIESLPSLIDAGARALKIEGRMRSPRYAGLTAYLYRKALDSAFSGGAALDPKELRDLEQVFCRGGGSSPGYLFTHAGSGMMSAESPKNSGLPCGKVEAVSPDGRCRVRAETGVIPGDGVEIRTENEPRPGAGVGEKASPGGVFTVKPGPGARIEKGDRVFKTADKALDDFCDRLIAQDERKIDVLAEFEATPGERARFALKHGGAVAEGFSRIPAQAAESAAASEVIRRNFSKTGGTTFNLVWERFAVGDGVFLPVSEINSLRRRAAGSLAGRITAARAEGGWGSDATCTAGGDVRDSGCATVDTAGATAMAGGDVRDSGGATAGNAVRDFASASAGTARWGIAAERGAGYPGISALVYSPEQISAVLSGPLKIDRLILETDALGIHAREASLTALASAAKACRRADAAFYIALPATETGCDGDWAGLDADGFLIRSWGQLRALKGRDAGKIVDYTLPAWNRAAAEFLLERALTPGLNAGWADADMPNSRICMLTVSPEFDPGVGARAGPVSRAGERPPQSAAGFGEAGERPPQSAAGFGRARENPPQSMAGFGGAGERHPQSAAGFGGTGERHPQSAAGFARMGEQPITKTAPASGAVVPLEKIVYGRIPLMTTRQCPVGNWIAKRGKDGFRCGYENSGGGFRLIDRKGAEYPVIPRCGTCDALIMSAKPLAENPLDGRRMEELRKYASLRLIFTTEKAGEIRDVLERWACCRSFTRDYSRIT